MTDASGPLLYGALASWWPLLSAPAEYEEEAGFYRDLLAGACAPRTVLELGSGGGNNASHLRAHFELTLVDRSEEMLAVSRRLNPGCEHIRGDMRTVRLGRTFDAVFIHDAIQYLTTREDLRRALETARIHRREGGAVLLVPDCFRETFEPGVSTGGSDGDGRALRFIEWAHDPDPADETFVADHAYLLRSGAGDADRVEVVHDRHSLGLFSRETWLELCREAGLRPEIRRVFHSDRAPEGTEVILCR